MTLHGQSTGGFGGSGSGNGNDMTLGSYANGVPNIRLSQIPASFMRQLPWMLPAILVTVAASWWFTKDVKREYQADGRILVQLGSEYVYDPETGGNRNGGMTITPDQVVQTEVGIIKTSTIIDQVIHEMISSASLGGVGGERFAPKLYEKWVHASPAEKTDRWNDIVKAVDKSYVIMPKPKSSIVDLVYKHEDGEVAVRALDAFMNAYLDFRNNIFVSEASGLIAEQRAATEDQLSGIERKVQRILNKNGISDFASERTGVNKRSQTLRTELNTLRGQMSAMEAALAATENQLRQTPRTIDLHVDDRAPQRLAQAELERRQLLAKYLPTSSKVRMKELEISEIRAQIQANEGKPAGGRRVGPNPVHQDVMKQRNKFQAQADSFREQEITLQAQLNASIAKVTRMRKLSPSYKNLLREKATLEERLKALNAKEQVALVNRQQQDAKSENIKVITRPSTPRKGRNMQKILFALASLGAIFTVFMLALLRVFLDPKLYGPTGDTYVAPIPEAAAASVTPVYQDAIPEAVPSFEPQHPTAPPAYAPAAQGGLEEYVPESFAQQEYGVPAYDAQTYDANAFEAAAQTQAYDAAPQVYADGSYAQPQGNPYLQTAREGAPVQDYAGPESNIPVLGTVEFKPYTG